MAYFRIDIEDLSEGVTEYSTLEDLIQETNYFYHETFSNDEEYDENREYKTLQECIDLWEGNGYVVALELKGSEE